MLPETRLLVIFLTVVSSIAFIIFLGLLHHEAHAQTPDMTLLTC